MKSEEIVDVFHEISNIWNPKYCLKYKEALINTKIFFETDAKQEAEQIRLIMDKEYLSSFLFDNSKKIKNFFELDKKIQKYKDYYRNPGIFILGSGNTGLPLIINIIIGIITGKHVYFRASQGNREAIKIWIKSLNDPSLMEQSSRKDIFAYIINNITEIQLSYNDEEYRKTLKSLDIQKAYLWGGAKAIENTINMIKENVIKYLFGPRTGVLFIDFDYWNNFDTRTKKEISQAIYDNLLIFDAALCSTPTRGIFIGEDSEINLFFNEFFENINPHNDEYSRLAREVVQSSNFFRISMNQWKKFGYKIYNSNKTNIIIAVGNFKKFQKRNELAPSQFDYHSSLGSIEVIKIKKDELKSAAKMIAKLQLEKRYHDLWCVGHIITIANQKIISELLSYIDKIQISDSLHSNSSKILRVGELRIVDVRKNIGRQPGVSFDGIYLTPSMFEIHVSNSE